MFKEIPSIVHHTSRKVHSKIVIYTFEYIFGRENVKDLHTDAKQRMLTFGKIAV